MPPQPSVTQIRLNNITTCLTRTADTVELLASSLNAPFLEAISNTTQSLLKNIQTIKQKKNDCTELLEEAYKLLNAVLMVHVKSHTGGELPPSVLSHIGKFTETLHKIHTFVEAQQNGSKVKSFFRQGNEHTAQGMQGRIATRMIDTANIMKILPMQEDAENRHKAVLNMIEALSDRTSSDGASSISRVYSGSQTAQSSTSISMLPSEPKIFHGRESELSEILSLFDQGSPRIAVLGGVIQHFSSSSHSLLILDNLEPLWEPMESQANIEEFLSLLTDNTHNPEEVDQVLSLTDNMPLAINLLAHLVDSEVLIQTTLAYSDGNKRLKALVPIREYMQKIMPPGYNLVQPLLKHFKELLELFLEYRGAQSNSATVARISSNYSNIQNILWNGTQQGHPDLVIGWGQIPFTHQIHNILPRPCDHRLEVYYILSLFHSDHSPSLSDAETLGFEALEHFKHFDDPELKCRLYHALTVNCRLKYDISTATKHCETGLSLALSIGNTKMQSGGLTHLAWIKRATGDYFTAQVHANEAQMLARLSADLFKEAQALHIMIMCWYLLGNYKQSILLSSRARDLIALCGMSDGDLDHRIMSNQAESHKLKSEYVAARSIHSRILQETSVTQNFDAYGLALLNTAEIDVSIDAPKENIQSVFEKTREIFNIRNFMREVTMCDMVLADLYLREGNLLEAKTLFESCLKSSFREPEITSYCLERLGNASRWSAYVSSWTTVFFVHSAKRKEKLGIYKALQFLGDVFLAQDDEHTAINLFTVALEGFTYMDVHRSRAECMLQLGDISKGHGDLLKAVEFWTTARPLFEQSSQAKQVKHIIANVGTEGANENFLFWTLFEFRDRFAHISLMIARIAKIYSFVPFLRGTSTLSHPTTQRHEKNTFKDTFACYSYEWHKQARNTANIREVFTTQSGVNVSWQRLRCGPATGDRQVGSLQEGHKCFHSLAANLAGGDARKGRGRAGTSMDQMELVVNLDAARADALRWGYFTNYWGLDGLRMIWRLGELV
ncbi:hypothetical protein B0H13DRAFT_1909980 [Mycena leptocephala]|nr:hypothetical protein B0H13DRAFT_1909980 [Mycena leptocephala]